MLKTLNIKNYAIVDNLTIEFDKGFNVFTGETGAGKSIIVGALSLLTRGRSDASIIKHGKDKTVIEGVFDINDDEILNKLKDQDIDVEDEIIVKRVITSDNRNSIKINESTVTLSFLEDLFSSYIDIHSQKDNHFLYNKKNQLILLDKYAKVNDSLALYKEAFNDYKKQQAEYDDLLNNEYNESEIDFIKFDLNELDEAGLSIEEEENLEASEKRFKSIEKYLNTLNESIGLFENDNGIKEKLYEVTNLLDIDDEEVNDVSNMIKELYYSLDDEFDRLKSILSKISDSDLNIEQIEERLYLYSKLKRKHKTDVSGLLEKQANLRNKLMLLENRDRVLADKKKLVDNSFNKARDLALSISKMRQSAAKKLEEAVLINTNDLLLNNLKFEISFNEIELNNNGLDEIEFLVSMNKGEELKPLKNVASGGEISRLMLALKVVFAKLSNTGLLILDEIDTGVSGRVALAIGEKIAKISKDVEVIAISHLAPVASCANSHYLIYKTDDETSTVTNVKKLNKDEIIEQLAIISNTSTDSSALKAAEELYLSSQSKVNENN